MKINEFEALWLLEQERLFSMLVASTLRRQDAEDILQLTAIRALRHFYKLKNRKYFSTWIYRIALNEKKRYYKKEAEITFLSIEELDAYMEQFSFTIEEGIIGQLTLEELLNDLPSRWGPAFYLRYVQNYTAKEISEMMNVHHSYVSRRLKALKGMVEEKLGIDL